MLIVVAIVIGVVMIVAVVAAVATTRRRRRPGAPADTGADPHAADVAPDPGLPMTDLDDALHNVTDTTGTTIADRLDEEAEIVDHLRVTDDTGPLLRRALDSIESHDAAHHPADDAPDADEPDPAG